jgi:hypothetical protein
MPNSISSTIADVIEYLKQHEETLVIREERVHNQLITTANHELVHHDDNGKLILPPSQLESFKQIVIELGLQESDDINKQNTAKGYTLLIQATINHNASLVTTILDLGGDPSIPDHLGNNAFIHAASSAHSSILKEFITLIQPEEAPKNNKKENDAETKAMVAPTLQKSTAASPRAEVTQTNKKASVAINQRVKLDRSVLLHANTIGETPEHLMQVYKEKNKDKLKPDTATEKNQKSPDNRRKSAQVQPQDHFERFKDLLDEVHQLQKNSSPVPATHKNSAPANSTTTNASFQPDRTYEDKIYKACHRYDKFFSKKFTLFGDFYLDKAKLDEKYIASAKAREKTRLWHTWNFEIPFPSTTPSMPAYSEDKARVKAALNLLKDYYAPESAPVKKGFQWNALRRLLTFHIGRRYCKEAENLYNQLQSQLLNDAKDILNIHNILEEKLNEIRKLPHDKKNSNSIINSSYTRRLCYMVESLKKTEAYSHIMMGLSRNDYLNSIDTQYMVKGVMPFPPKLR